MWWKFLILALFSSNSVSQMCTWDSALGSHFDLRPLAVSNGGSVYKIIDGDIPCTPEVEPSFGYAWNFCEDIPTSLLPAQCSKYGTTGIVLQYVQYVPDVAYCYKLAHSQSKDNVISYALLDKADPSQGISISYPSGDVCKQSASPDDPLGKIQRRVTVNVQCANVKALTVSAQEPQTCSYHLSMKSYHGCPLECPVTSYGLCSSHGHCAYDNVNKMSYCYCNEGYYGSACDSTTAPSTTSSPPPSYDGFSVQIGLLVTLLLVALGLTAGLFYVGSQIAVFRKEQVSSHYKTLAGGESEMVDTVVFR